MSETIIGGYIPGMIGRVVALHACYYNTVWGFGLYFEVKVAAELSAFMQRFDSDRDGIWTASRGGQVEGAIVIDGLEAEKEGAHLRWFILSEELHDQGFGNRLLKEAVQFCRQKKYHQVYLWTFHGLYPARHLYEKFGFSMTEQHMGKQWGKEVLEQQFVLNLP